MQPDPTNGQGKRVLEYITRVLLTLGWILVNYIGQSDAVAAGLVSSTPQSSIMRADYRTDLSVPVSHHVCIH